MVFYVVYVVVSKGYVVDRQLYVLDHESYVLVRDVYVVNRVTYVAQTIITVFYALEEGGVVEYETDMSLQRSLLLVY